MYFFGSLALFDGHHEIFIAMCFLESWLANVFYIFKIANTVLCKISFYLIETEFIVWAATWFIRMSFGPYAVIFPKTNRANIVHAALT